MDFAAQYEAEDNAQYERFIEVIREGMNMFGLNFDDVLHGHLRRAALEGWVTDTETLKRLGV